MCSTLCLTLVEQSQSENKMSKKKISVLLSQIFNVLFVNRYNKIRIKLKAYDHNLIDVAAEKIVETAKRSGVQVSGPIPLPTDKEVVTILRAVHKYKDSREQFELRTYKRLIDIYNPSKKVIDALTEVDVPAGVGIEMKVKK